MQRLLKSKAVLFSLGVLVVVGILGALAYFLPRFMPFEIRIATADPAKHDAETAQAAPEKPHAVIVYALGDRVVNLADTGMVRYLKVNIALEFASEDEQELSGEQYKKKQEELAKKLVSRKERMEDIVTTVLSGRLAADLVTPVGKETVRSELKERLGAAAGPERLLSVYFTQFLIQ